MANDDRVIEAIYDAAIDAEAWTRVCDQIAHRIGRSHLALGWQGLPTGLHIVAGRGFEPETIQHVAITHEDSLANIAGALQHRRDRYLDWRNAQHISLRLLDDIDAGLSLREGVVQEGGIRLSQQSGSVQLVGIFRAEDQARLSPSDVAFLNRVAPHVDRVLHLFRKQAEHRALAQGMQTAFDLVACGILLLRSDLSPILFNRKANEILAGADGLALRGQQVRIATPKVHSWFADAVAHAATRSRGGTSTGRIPRLQSHLPAYRVDVAAGEHGVALVFLTDPAPRFASAAERLRNYAGLSKMQADIALGVVQGGEAQTIANALGVSPHTVKTHLNRAMHKLDCRDRVSLTRRITLILAAVST